MVHSGFAVFLAIRCESCVSAIVAVGGGTEKVKYHTSHVSLEEESSGKYIGADRDSLTDRYSFLLDLSPNINGVFDDTEKSVHRAPE